MKSMRGEGKRRSLERLVEKENTSKIFNASDDNILFVPTHYTTVVPLAAVQTHRSPLDTYFAKIFFSPQGTRVSSFHESIQLRRRGI